MKKAMNVIGKIAVVVVCAVWVWGIASWVEIACKNTKPNPHYSEYNLLVSVIESREVR